jgi:hypothetical protein
MRAVLLRGQGVKLAAELFRHTHGCQSLCIDRWPCQSGRFCIIDDGLHHRGGSGGLRRRFAGLRSRKGGRYNKDAQARAVTARIFSADVTMFNPLLF